MGLFDSVYVGCAWCGKPLEFQSKAGDCGMHVYRSFEATPPEVLNSVLNEPEYCQHCGNWSAIYDPGFPPNAEPPRAHPSMRKVRAATSPSIHSQGMRWWNEPFSAADIIDD
jgi:hypothetical protein